MNRPLLFTLVGVLATTHLAVADAPMIDPEDAVNPIAIVEGAGVKVGDGTVLHPQAGIEAGMVSNVFYTQNDPVAAGLLRALFEVGAGSLSAKRLAIPEHNADTTVGEPNYGDFEYRADARVSYDAYLSNDPRVTAQDGTGIGALFRGIVHPGQTVQFLIYENFNRLIRPTNFESTANTDRDINDVRSYRSSTHPPVRNFAGIFHYENAIDVIESDTQKFANRFLNVAGIGGRYQILPITRLSLDISQGISTGIDGSAKVTSYPLILMAGVQTLVTPKSSVVARLGYTDGFYQSGPSYSSILAALEVGFRYSPTGRIAGLYEYNVNDSINANFYRDHQISLTVEHAFLPFDTFIQGELVFREYNGVINSFTTPVMYGTGIRDDVIGIIIAEARYKFRDWLAISAAYHLDVDSTDFTYNAGTGVAMFNPSYVRHEVLVGVRAAY